MIYTAIVGTLQSGSDRMLLLTSVVFNEFEFSKRYRCLFNGKTCKFKTLTILHET